MCLAVGGDHPVTVQRQCAVVEQPVVAELAEPADDDRLAGGRPPRVERRIGGTQRRRAGFVGIGEHIARGRQFGQHHDVGTLRDSVGDGTRRQLDVGGHRPEGGRDLCAGDAGHSCRLASPQRPGRGEERTEKNMASEHRRTRRRDEVPPLHRTVDVRAAAADLRGARRRRPDRRRAVRQRGVLPAGSAVRALACAGGLQAVAAVQPRARCRAVRHPAGRRLRRHRGQPVRHRRGDRDDRHRDDRPAQGRVDGADHRR